MPTTAQELFIIVLILAGAIGWQVLRTRARPRLALACFLACTALACVLANHWNISAGL